MKLWGFVGTEGGKVYELCMLPRSSQVFPELAWSSA